jgi:phage shock protein C
MTSAPLPGSPSDIPSDIPSDAAPPARPPLLRSGTDRMAGGVCGGLAEYSGIDSLLWRVGFVGLTVAGGAGIPIYLLLWVLMPSAPLPAVTSRSPVERLVDRLHRAVSGALDSARRT